MQTKDTGIIRFILQKLQRPPAIRVFIIFLFSAFLCLGYYKAYTNANSSPAGYTDAPGEGNCTSCHTGSTITSPSTVINVTINGTKNYYYKPDTTYTFAISASKNGISKWGYEATILKDSDNSFIGTMATTSITSSIISTIISGGKRYYATQTSSGNTGSNGRSWSFTWKAPHNFVGDITLYVTACAANNNGLETGDLIYGNKYVLKPAPVVPEPGFTFFPLHPCEGDTVYLNDTSTYAPSSWKWTFTGGTPGTSTLKSPKVVFKVWGGHKMTVVATNSQGPSVPVTKIITVNQKPLDTVYRSRPLEFCLGDSTRLTAYTGTKFLWSTGDTLPSILVKKSGTYYVDVTWNTCTVRSKNVVVKVHSKPVNNLSRVSGGDTLCAGDVVSFKLATSGWTYKYYNGKNLLSNTGLSFSLPGLTGNANKIYSIAFDSLGCKSDTSTKYIEIVKTRLPAPVLSAGKSTTQSATVTWKPVTGATGYEISEDSGKTWETTSGNLYFTHIGMNPKTSISLKVRTIDALPCGYGNSATLVVSSLPCSIKTYKVNYDTLICPKSISRFTFSNISSSSYGLILNGTASKDTNYSFYLTKDSSVHFEIYDSSQSNCGILPVDLPVRVIKYPKLAITADKPFYCGSNDPATISGNGNFEEYDVFVNGKLVQNDIINTYTTNSFSKGDTVQMLAKYQGCISDSSNKIILNRFPAANAFFNYKSDGQGIFEFINKSTGASAQTWSFGDGGMDTASNPAHTYVTNKIYTVWLVVTGTGGCKDSISKTITASGIPSPGTDEAQIKIIPNPFGDYFTVSYPSTSNAVIAIHLFDIMGQPVLQNEHWVAGPGTNEIMINTQGLVPGAYFLRLDSENRVFVRRLIKN